MTTSPTTPPAVVGTEPSLVRRPVRVPRSLEIATGWAWRVLIVGAAVYAVAFLVIGNVQLVAVPLLLAVLVAALLQPVMRGMFRLRVPKFAAAGVSVVLFLGLVVAAVTLVSQQIASGISEAGASAAQGLDQISGQLADLLGMSPTQFDSAVQSVVQSVGQQSSQLLSGAVTATGTATSVLTGLLLMLFAVYFYLADGDRIWMFLVSLLPREGRHQADLAGRRSWTTLSAYVRAVPVVALVDATGIGLGAAVLQVPFAIPIAIITFIGAFIPVVGAIITGVLAVLVALVTQGPVTALILLVVVFAVQQVESYLLQPLLLGRAVQLHPLAVVASITAGIVLAGIVGGVLAVPLLAMAVTFIRSLAAPDDDASLPTPHGAPVPEEAPAAGTDDTARTAAR